MLDISGNSLDEMTASLIGDAIDSGNIKELHMKMCKIDDVIGLSLLRYRKRRSRLSDCSKVGAAFYIHLLRGFG